MAFGPITSRFLVERDINTSQKWRKKYAQLHAKKVVRTLKTLLCIPAVHNLQTAASLNSNDLPWNNLGKNLI